TRKGGARYDQASRPISTGQLSASPHLHLRPINLVISQGPSVRPKAEGIPHLGEGFALICFQRFSFPDIATQRCSWRNNWYTSGPSIPVLSYLGQIPSSILRPPQIGTELSHDVLNPAHVLL